MSAGESGASIDELLDRAVRALNDGDRAAATTLAEHDRSPRSGALQTEE